MSPLAEAVASVTDLPAPEGIQKEVMTLKPEGHAVVLGTAGSGKTVLAALRALHLADSANEHSGKTLLVTYNKSLLASLNHLIPKGTDNLDVCTYHQFARNYLNERGKMERGWTVLGNHKMGLVKQALEEVRQQSTEEILEKPTGFFVPELDWIVQNGYLTEESYLKAERIGRGEPLSEQARKAVFQIQKAYWRLRSEVGKHYDWADMPAATHIELQKDDGERAYRHVVIDDGQDFSPEMLRSLALAIPKDGSLTFFGDPAQQIYGRGISWRSAGLNVSKVWELTRNYRSSPELAKLASAIAAMPYFKEQADMVAADGFSASGPQPSLVTFANQKAEDAFVVEQAEALAATGSVAVLCRREAEAARIGKQFEKARGLHKDMSSWQPGPGIVYGNIHSAKGYEFQSVILVGVTKNKWPERRMSSAIGREQATMMDGRLLYVAVTRARENLIMTATRALTELLPSNDDLWEEKQVSPPAKTKAKATPVFMTETESEEAEEQAPDQAEAGPFEEAAEAPAEQIEDTAPEPIDDTVPDLAEEEPAAAEPVAEEPVKSDQAENQTSDEIAEPVAAETPSAEAETQPKAPEQATEAPSEQAESKAAEQTAIALNVS